jgi:opacity protein-like surface antigen
MKRQFALCMLCLMASPTFAADKNGFSGFSVGFAAGGMHNSVDYSGYIEGNSSSKNDYLGALNAGYGFAFGDSMVLSVGASYVLGKSEFGETRYLDGAQSGVVKGKYKDHWSVYVAPGYRFAPDWLAYGKLAYHEMKSEYSDSLVGSGESRHHGIGYGAGVGYALSQNIDLNAEVQHVEFSRAHFALSSGKPAVTQYTVGINYRF